MLFIYLAIQLLFLSQSVWSFGAGWTRPIESLFDITSSNSGKAAGSKPNRNHYQMTQCALFRITHEYLARTRPTRAVLWSKTRWWSNGRVEQESCSQAKISLQNLFNDQQPSLNLNFNTYLSAINSICDTNRLVDLIEPFTSEAHFDDESFIKSAKRVKLFLQSSQHACQARSFDVARIHMGRALHTLQDFYSHTNWAEFDSKHVNEKLGKEVILGQMSEPDQPTCVVCTSETCQSEIVPELLQNRVLTSGYFSKKKPEGKCSHGGSLDRTVGDKSGPTYTGPGINKDSAHAPHGSLHYAAADLAFQSTLNTLNEFWSLVGDERFGKFLGLASKNQLALVVNSATKKEFSLSGEKKKLLATPSGQSIELTDISIYQNLLKKIRNSQPHTILYYTLVNQVKETNENASLSTPKSSLFMAQLSNLAFKKNIVLNVLTPASNETTSRCIQVLTQVCEHSGGSMYSYTNSKMLSELITSLEQVRDDSPETILIANTAKKSFHEFRVDENVDRLYIYIRTKNPVAVNQSKILFDLIDPQFEPYDLSRLQPMVTDTNLRLFFLDHPEGGQWSIQLQLSSSYDLRISAKTSIKSIIELSQPLRTSKPHENAASSSVNVNSRSLSVNTPRVNSKLTVSATLANLMSSSVHKAYLALITNGNERILKKRRMTVLDKESNRTLLSANFKVPRVESGFRLKLLVCFRHNACIQRVSSNLLQPAMISVRLVKQREIHKHSHFKSPLYLSLNKKYELSFEIENHDKLLDSAVLLTVRDSMRLINSERNLVLAKKAQLKQAFPLIRVPNDQNLVGKQNELLVYVEPVLGNGTNHRSGWLTSLVLPIVQENMDLNMNPACDVVREERSTKCGDSSDGKKKSCDMEETWRAVVLVTDSNNVGLSSVTVSRHETGDNDAMIRLIYDRKKLVSKSKGRTQLVEIEADCCAGRFDVIVADRLGNYEKCSFH